MEEEKKKYDRAVQRWFRAMSEAKLVQKWVEEDKKREEAERRARLKRMRRSFWEKVMDTLGALASFASFYYIVRWLENYFRGNGE